MLLFILFVSIIIAAVVNNIKNNRLTLVVDPKVIEKVNTVLGHVGFNTSSAIDLGSDVHSDVHDDWSDLDYDLYDDKYDCEYGDQYTMDYLMYGGTYDYAAMYENEYAKHMGATKSTTSATTKKIKYDMYIHGTHGKYMDSAMHADADDAVYDMSAVLPKVNKSTSYRNDHSRKNYSRIHKIDKINRAACRSPYKAYDEEYMVEA